MTTPEPPFLGLGHGAATVDVGSVVNLCVLGFKIKSPVIVDVTGPNGFQSTFEVWVGTNSVSDPTSDPLAGASMNSPHGTVSWVWRSGHPTGSYTFSARQDDLALTTAVEAKVGDRLWIEAIDRLPLAGGEARFAISGASPGHEIPLWVYRDTGVIDEDHPEGCDQCSIFEWYRDVDPTVADEAGSAFVGVAIDDGYQPFNAFCLVTSLMEPACSSYEGGWFEVRT